MIEQNLIPLTAAFALAALALLAGALMARRRMRGSKEGVRRLTIFLDERAAMLPIILSTARVDLVERDTAIEHQLWTFTQFDSLTAGATAALADRRRGLDALRVRVEGSRTNVERLKSALRMIMRVIELRRTILG